MSREQHRVKRWAPKNKTGCLTCRARRVKCDEGRPQCQRCVRIARSCHYSNDVSTRSSYGRPLRFLSPAYGDPECSWYHNVYTTLTMPWLSHYSDDGLFDQILPQASWQHPALRHALVAVSMASEQYYAVQSFVQSHRRIWHYNEALRLLYTDSSIEHDLVLAACVLFWVHDNFTCNMSATLIHLRGLLKMTEESKVRAVEKGRPVSALTHSVMYSLFYWGSNMTVNDPVRDDDRAVITHLRRRLDDPDYHHVFPDKRTIDQEAKACSRALHRALVTASPSSGSRSEDSISCEELEQFMHKWHGSVIRGKCLLSPEDRIAIDCHYSLILLELRFVQGGDDNTSQSLMADPTAIAEIETLLTKLESIRVETRQSNPVGMELAMPVVATLGEIARLVVNTPLMARTVRLLRNMKRMEACWSSDVVAALVESLAGQEHYSGERLNVSAVETAAVSFGVGK